MPCPTSPGSTGDILDQLASVVLKKLGRMNLCRDDDVLPGQPLYGPPKQLHASKMILLLLAEYTMEVEGEIDNHGVGGDG